MSIPDELAQLADLHQRGVLSAEEFARAKARVLAGDGAGRTDAPALAAINGLRRSRDNRWFGGVCGGISQVTGVAAWAWRLLFASLVMCAGTGLLVYLLMWLLVPLEAPTFEGRQGGMPAHP